MEDAEDLFATITASQEEKLRSCDFVGASPENSNSVSSSPPRTPPQQSGSAGRATSQPYLSGSENPRPNGKEQAHIEVIDLDSDEDGDEVGLIRKKKTAPESHLRESNSCLGKRKLPASMEECEKASDGGVKIGGFKDLMEALQGVLEKAGDGSHGGEGLSLLETAERAGPGEMAVHRAAPGARLCDEARHGEQFGLGERAVGRNIQQQVSPSSTDSESVEKGKGTKAKAQTTKASSGGTNTTSGVEKSKSKAKRPRSEIVVSTKLDVIIVKESCLQTLKRMGEYRA
nr:uncharacterized protein LOC109152952 isoform X2 [Ipomoea batatas]